jgi:hypothetical protein
VGEEVVMRFVVVIERVSEPGVDPAAPTGDVAAGWAQLHQEMVAAGVLVAGGGLVPPELGTRVTITGDEVIVMTGPFAETRNVLVGVWVLQVPSREEALTWVRRIPRESSTLIRVELRAVTDDTDPRIDTSPADTPPVQARPDVEIAHQG